MHALILCLKQGALRHFSPTSWYECAKHFKLRVANISTDTVTTVTFKESNPHPLSSSATFGNLLSSICIFMITAYHLYGMTEITNLHRYLLSFVPKKTSKMQSDFTVLCQCQNIPIFDNVLDVFSRQGDRIELIPFALSQAS